MSDKTSAQKSKDRLALIVSLVFVIILGIGGYRYFNESSTNLLNDILNGDTIAIDENTNNNSNANENESNANANNTNESQQTDETVWVATNYQEGQIEPGEYTVRAGDTLWEIAEAVYGDGFEWNTILEANSDSVDFLANGEQALIYTGQVLVIPNR